MPKIKDLKQRPNFATLEEEVMEFWRVDQTFKKSIEQKDPQKSYVFYDGPPFATGLPHYGHLLASTIKDVVPRYWTMKGYRVDRVWGWDCHGLPIENMIEKKLDIKGGKKGIEALGISTFNQACRSEVMRLDGAWETIIERLGRWVDFKNNYKTMDTTFMESVWWGFKQLVEKDLVYEGKRVILYCPRCATPLSNFEIAMDNSYEEVTEPSNTYKYKLNEHENTYLLAWSTTPWNKLATPALAVNPDLTYVKVKQGEEYYILAESTVGMLNDQPYTIVERMTGLDLEKLTFEPHYDFFPDRKNNERSGVIISDNFVTADDGTGVVTLAVYGEDDYRVMKAHNIQMVEHVDSEGKLKAEVTPWAGMYLLKVNPLVNEDLKNRGLMYSEHMHTHSVAKCYRCNTRLYYAPLPAWFINVQKLKDQLIAKNENINWFPEHLKHGRFGQGLENAPDWNISRSRYWGTPMPIWISSSLPQGDESRNKRGNSSAKAPDKSGNVAESRLRVIGSIKELQTWAVEPKLVEGITDIHREYLDDIEVWIDDDKTIKGKRIPEVFDCWVESGSMPFASRHYPFEDKQGFESNYPAQFVSEYIAQTRAWFYTMHVMSVGIFGKEPFENVLTTGTILAEDGSKMSKSKNNYPDPMKVINEFGVDSLRLYLMSSPVMKAENLNFSEKEVSDIRKKVLLIWWNIFTFYKMYAGDHQYKVEIQPQPVDVMDRWVMSRMHTTIKLVTEYMDSYNVVKASRVLMELIDELSTWYLRRSRDRLRDADQSALDVFGYVLTTLAQLFAPFAPFFSETIWHNMIDETSSVHLSTWPTVDNNYISDELESKMVEVRKVVEKAHALRSESGIKVRQPLPKVTVHSTVSSPDEELRNVLADEINVKVVDWNPSQDFTVELDTTLTAELEEEGKAREVIRAIQQLRKDEGLQPGQMITVQFPDWPSTWESEIKQKTSVTELVKGEKKIV